MEKIAKLKAELRSELAKMKADMMAELTSWKEELSELKSELHIQKSVWGNL